jgi:hypothetical protein
VKRVLKVFVECPLVLIRKPCLFTFYLHVDSVAAVLTISVFIVFMFSFVFFRNVDKFFKTIAKLASS